MKKVFYLFLIGSAMLICPLQSKAESYSLVRTVIYVGQKNNTGSKAPARPLDSIGDSVPL